MEKIDLFNAVIGLLNLLIGFFLKLIWDAIKDLQRADAKIAAEVTAIQVLVAGDYVKREYFEKKVDAIFLKLDKIQAATEHQNERPN